MKKLLKSTLAAIALLLSVTLITNHPPAAADQFNDLKSFIPSTLDIATTTSTTPVVLVYNTDKRVYPTTLLFFNSSSSTRTITLQSSGGKILLQFLLPASGSFIFDGRGDVATRQSEHLQMYADAGSDVTVTGAYVRK